MTTSVNISAQQVLDALRRVRDPKSGQDIVTLGWIGEIQMRFGNVSFTVHTPQDSTFPESELKSACAGAVKQIPGVQAVLPTITKKPRPESPALATGASNIRHIIVVGSGKGGVGKSTSAVNLAAALQKRGHRVGLLDADIYGPSVPTMLGKGYADKIGPGLIQTRNELMVPLEMHGLKVMSVGMLIEKNQPTVWRAPIATKMIQQFLTGVDWGNLDFLVIDLPPGTGDIQLTISQQTNVSGAVVVTSPQKVALQIAEKGLLMFRHVGVPILGILETMSGFGCEQCGHVTPIFGEGGARNLARDLHIPLLGQIPLDAKLVQACDAGEPIVLSNPEAASAQAYLQAADALGISLEKLSSKSAVDADIVPLAVEGVPNNPDNGERHSLAIYWSDGWKYSYDCRELRFACPCAACVDEFSGKRRIQKENVDQDIFIDKALPVGRYGVNLVWTDGHSTGIYTYKYLRELDARKVEERPPMNSSASPAVH